MFWIGCVVGVLVFALAEWGLMRIKSKNGELVFGIYDKKRDQWRVNREFHQHAASIGERRHSRPGSIKYID